MTIEELREWKKELGYSYKKIAELSGLPVETVQRVLGGIEKSPEYGVVKELEKVLVPIELQSWLSFSKLIDAPFFRLNAAF